MRALYAQSVFEAIIASKPLEERYLRLKRPVLGRQQLELVLQAGPFFDDGEFSVQRFGPFADNRVGQRRLTANGRSDVRLASWGGKKNVWCVPLEIQRELYTKVEA